MKTSKKEWPYEERRRNKERRSGELDKLYREAAEQGALLERRRAIRRKIDQYMEGQLDLRSYILSCFGSGQKEEAFR